MAKQWFFYWLIFWLWFPSNSYAGVIATFNGQINFTKKKFDLTLKLEDKTSIATQLTSSPDNKIYLTAQINHLKAHGFNLSTELQSIIERIDKENSLGQICHGTIESRYSLINYKPVRELSGLFEIKKQRLFINSLAWEGFNISGHIDLWHPFSVDLLIFFEDVHLTDIALLLGCHESDLRLSSFASGQIKLTGHIGNLFLKGKAVSYEGNIEDLKYDSLMVNFEGFYPRVEVFDSRVVQTDGLNYNLEGYFEFTGGCDISDKMGNLKTSAVVEQKPADREWTIKSKQEQGSRQATEFKYRLKLPGDSETTFGKEEGLLGVEHSIKF